MVGCSPWPGERHGGPKKIVGVRGHRGRHFGEHVEVCRMGRNSVGTEFASREERKKLIQGHSRSKFMDCRNLNVCLIETKFGGPFGDKAY